MESSLLSLEWLLGQRALQLQEVIHSDQDFAAIQTSEVPDPTDFLMPRSIVLSIGLSFKDNPTGLYDWAGRLANSGVVAIGLGLGFAFEQVPRELIAAARDHNLGLFTVPRQIPFISLTQAVAAEQSRRAEIAHKELLKNQQRLNNAAITGGISGLIKELGIILSGAVAVVDSDGRVAANHTHPGKDPAQPYDAVPQALATLNAGSQAFSDDGGYSIVHKMTRSGDRHHVLSVLLPHRPTSDQRALIRHCGGLADILVQRPVAQRARQEELNTLAMSLLLNQAAAGSSNAREIFADISDSEGTIRPVIIAASSHSLIKRALNTVASAQRAADRSPCQLLLSTSPEPTALLFFRGSRSPHNIISLFGSHVARLRMCIGLPTPVENITAELVDELTSHALTAHTGTSLLPEDSSSLWFRNPLIMQALDERASHTLTRLALFDEKHNTDLSPTLVSYIHNNAQLGACATELGIHRHTARSRIEKIQNICEIDLHNPLTQAELLLVIASRPR